MARIRLTLLLVLLAALGAPGIPGAETWLTPEALVAEALGRNPDIAAARGRAAAAAERVPQAAALEDPRLGLGVTNLPTDFSFEDDDMTQKEISLTQKLPFPGKRGRMRAVAAREAQAAAEEIAAAADRVASEVKSAFYELSHAWRAIEVVRRNKELLESLVRVAEARYGLGEGQQPALVAGRIELARMVDELLMLEQSRTAVEARIAALLDRDPGAPLGRPAAVTYRPAAVDAERLKAEAVESNPTLKAMAAMVAARREGVALAEREVYPDFELRLAYGQRDDGPEGENRRDMISGMVSINIPIFYASRQGPKIAEARAELQAAEARLRAMRNETLGRIAGLCAMAGRLERQVALYESGILPQARLASHAALSGYAVNRIDFAGLLESHVKLHRAELDYHQALTDFEKTLAELEAAVGRPIRPRPEGP